MRIVFESSVTDVKPLNSSFDSGVLRIFYHGHNRNGSCITKESVNRSIDSIYNCPVVCNYNRETDSIGGHDMELVCDEDGGMHIVNITHPIGVVPESARVWWQEIEDEGGVHEYLCTDILLWKRQEAYRKIVENGVTDQSMEITVLDGRLVDGLYIIDRFEFTAFCLLGDCEPCFEGASLELFSANDFKKQMAEMMRDLKQSYSMAQPSQEVVINDFVSEGGEEVLEEITKVTEEQEPEVEVVETPVEEPTEIIEEPAVEPEVVSEIEDETFSLDEESQPEVEDQETFALAEQFRVELMDALGSVRIETSCGDMPRYFYMEHDPEVCMVYCTDVEDWRLYGMSYSMNGDAVVIDFESKKRMKWAIVEFDEGDQPTMFSAVYDAIQKNYESSNQQWSEKYQAASDTIADMQSEIDVLRQFKADTEESVARAAALEAQNEVFDRFENLNGIEAFEALRTDCTENPGSMAVEDIEERCYAILGRSGLQAKFSAQEQGLPKTKVDTTRVDNEPYGGAFQHYGIGKN